MPRTETPALPVQAIHPIRHSLKAFGIKFGGTSRGAFDKAVREAVANDALTSELMDAMLTAPATLCQEYCRPHNSAVKFVDRNEQDTVLQALPSVGPVTALSFISTVVVARSWV